MRPRNSLGGRTYIIGIVVAVALLFTGSAAAYSFFDIEVSSENSLNAGSINLKVGWNESYNNNTVESQPLTDNPGEIFNLTGIEPGDEGEATISFKGESNPYWMNFYVNQTAGPKPEADEGLGDHLRFLIWQDDGDNRYENEKVIANGTAHEVGENLEEGVLLESNGSGFDTDLKHIGFKWSLPEKEVCELQNQEKIFEFGFEIFQERSNPEAEKEGFSDIEKSRNNSFSTANFSGCGECGGIKSPDEEDYMTERINGEESEALYEVGVKNSSRIKFDAEGAQLGEEGEVESDIFEITVENGGPDVWVKTKNGRAEEYVKLEGEGDQKEVPSGDFTLELVKIEQNNDGSTTYRIKITSDDESGGGPYGSNALSHIVFDFCESIKEKTYFQADLVEGEPIGDLSEQLYHDRGSMIRYRHGNSEEGLTSPSDYPDQPECVEADSFKIEAGKLESSFSVEQGGECNDGINISLVIYEKPYPGWEEKRAEEQIIHDYEKSTYQPGENDILKVEVPKKE